jgi:hypothetical protein
VAAVVINMATVIRFVVVGLLVVGSGILVGRMVAERPAPVRVVPAVSTVCMPGTSC